MLSGHSQSDGKFLLGLSIWQAGCGPDVGVLRNDSEQSPSETLSPTLHFMLGGVREGWSQLQRKVMV